MPVSRPDTSPPDTTPPDTDPATSQPAPVLATDDLRVELGGVPVLRGVSVEVGVGESVALLGGNGSGKSTLLRACLGLVPINHGRVELFGTPLSSFRQWRRIGYVPQRTPGAMRGATVAEVVGSGRLAVRIPFLPGGRRHRDAVRHALQRVDLWDRRHDELAHLSGGQQQRVLIARALVADPDLLVLDEPTAGVDLEHQHSLTEVVRGLLDHGRSMVVVLHEVGPLRAVIDRTVTLRHGRVSSTAPDSPGAGGGVCHDAPVGEPPLLPGPVVAGPINTRDGIDHA